MYCDPTIHNLVRYIQPIYLDSTDPFFKDFNHCRCDLVSKILFLLFYIDRLFMYSCHKSVSRDPTKEFLDLIILDLYIFSAGFRAYFFENISYSHYSFYI